MLKTSNHCHCRGLSPCRGFTQFVFFIDHNPKLVNPFLPFFISIISLTLQIEQRPTIQMIEL